MINSSFRKWPANINALYRPSALFWLLTTLGAMSLFLFAGESAALAEGDRVAEINELTTHVAKLAKNGCYITGTASALIGSIFAVAQQSLKIFGVAAAVTLLAFKAPAFFTSAMLI